MNAALIASLARQVLSIAGAAAVAAGYVTGGQSDAIVGGMAVAISVAWSWWTHKK